MKPLRVAMVFLIAVPFVALVLATLWHGLVVAVHEDKIMFDDPRCHCADR